MSKKVFSIIWPLLLVVIPVFIGYWLTREVPDVRYTLSEKIPVSFLSSTTNTQEIIPQLEIKNVGNAEAKNVVLRINGTITAYELEKYSFADNVQISNPQSSRFELVYPELPPQGGFKLIFKSIGTGIQYSDLQISHSTGLGNEALSPQPNSFVTIFSDAAGLIYIFLIFFSLKTSLLDSWKSQFKYKKLTDILKMQKPWYAFDKDWSSIYFEQFKEFLTEEASYSNELKDYSVYKLLNMEKPPSFDQYQWNEFQGTAIKKLNDLINTKINKAYSQSEIIDLLRNPKPSFFPDDKWKDLHLRASSVYVSFNHIYYLTKNIQKELTKPKPMEILEEAWEKRNQFLQDQFLIFLQAEMIRVGDPKEILMTENINLLSIEDQDIFKREALEITKAITKASLFHKILIKQELGDECPDGLEIWDWNKFKEIEERIHNIDKDEMSIDAIRESWQEIRYGKELGEKPQGLSDSDWDFIKQVEDCYKKLGEIEEEKEQLALETISLTNVKAQISELKQNLIHKLEVVHMILQDPSSIDRLEDFDDLFAPGNKENLRKVANVLREQFLQTDN